MKVVKTVDACGRKVTVTELTVGEIRAWLAGMTAQEAGGGGGDVVSLALFEDATLDDLTRMSDLTDEEIAAAAPSELDAVLEKVREVNKDFFSLRARLEKAGEAALRSKAA